MFYRAPRQGTVRMQRVINMKWFFLSPFSITVLNVAMLLVFMIYFLLKIEGKSSATRLLIVSLAGIELVFVAFFFIFSSVNPHVATLAWWVMHAVVFAFVAMVQFAYHFPENIHPRESKFVMVVCLVAASFVYPYYVYKTFSAEPVFRFDAYAYVFPRTPEIGIIIGLELLWILGVFIRKAAWFSDYTYTGRLLRYTDSRRRPFSLFSGFELIARAGIGCTRILKAKSRYSKAMRRLVLIFISPIILVSFIIMAYQGLVGWEIVAHVLGSGFMIIAFLFILVYVNSSPEPSTFMVKLIGISLGALLLAIGIGSSITIFIKENAYDEKHRLQAWQAARSMASGEIQEIPQEIAYIQLIKPMENTPTEAGRLLFTRDPQIATLMTGNTLAIGYPPGVRLPMQTAPDDKRWYRRLKPLDAEAYYLYYRIRLKKTVYEVGYDYLRFRAAIHSTGIMLVYVLVGAALFVFLFFPYFFKESLVKPLNALLDGVRKVNDGDLSVVVPVRVEDEIGFLSNSFNNMVQSVQKAREKLKSSLDYQVKLTESYSCFVPKEFLQFLKKDSIIDIHLGDNIQKEMTILFSDIRAFTRLSETMTPQENFNFINDCLSFIGPVVRKNSGFIDKYIGDAIMALFPHQPEDAVNAAIEMQAMLKTFNTRREEKGQEPIKIGIGINSGITMLGTIGEEKRMEGTVISDAVNLTSRLEGLTKLYGAGIIVSRSIINRIEKQSDFLFRFLDKVQVKGKANWIEVYEIFNSDAKTMVEMKLKTRADFERGIRLFQKRKLAEARTCFQQVAEISPHDKACQLYKLRCEQMLEYGIPEGWNGISAIEQK